MHLPSIEPSESRLHNRFTLIELLVVVAIIAVLASMLLPALGQARLRTKLALELANLRQTGLAITMYAGDNSEFLPGANDSRQRDHGVVRARLAPDYTEITRQTWGCPIAMYRAGWSQGKWMCTWWWNVGWGGACDVEGKNLTTTGRCAPENPPFCGYSWADGFKARIDGTGYTPRREPEEIVLITDSGGLPAAWTANIAPWSNHPQEGNLGIAEFSQSLTLSGLALKRVWPKLNRAWDGGNNVYR